MQSILNFRPVRVVLWLTIRKEIELKSKTFLQTIYSSRGSFQELTAIMFSFISGKYNAAFVNAEVARGGFSDLIL